VRHTAQQHCKQSDAWLAAAEYGCDMELLEEYLAMTAAERVRAHASALALAEKLRAAMEKTVEQSGSTSKAVA
jgi:hypothetical protein